MHSPFVTSSMRRWNWYRLIIQLAAGACATIRDVSTGSHILNYFTSDPADCSLNVEIVGSRRIEVALGHNASCIV